MFREPERLNPRHQRERITEAATARIGQVTQALERRGVPSLQAAHFLIRLVFAMFAGDVGLLPRDLLTRVLTRVRDRPDRSQDYFQELFANMKSGGEFWGEDIRYFNGGLFESQDALSLTREDAEILLHAAQFDWRTVEPAIFGTLFEQGLDSLTRSRRGAHFTSVADIVRLTEPVIMQPLWREWSDVRAKATQLTSKRNGKAEATELVRGFQQRLGALRVLDPACGSGNFLVVTLGQLLDLEHEVRQFGDELGAGAFALPPLVHPRQMLGLEIEPFARELASVTIWIAYFQWKEAHGGEWETPVLQPLDTVQQRDALLNTDLSEATWPQADFIVGNPPFMGDKVMQDRLGPAYTAALRTRYEGRLPGQSDLVCYWVQKAWEQVQQTPGLRVGFVTTNSIRTGRNREVLDHITVGGQIFAAWPDEPWLLGDAAVRVSIFAFDDGSEAEKTLAGRSVDQITSRLTSGVDVSLANPLAENLGIAFIGGMKKGRFDIPEEVARRWLDARNPSGMHNSEVLLPWVNGMDLTRRKSNRWIIDFGQRSEEEAAQYALPFIYVVQEVKPERAMVANQLERERWWQHGRTAPDLRRAITDLPRFIGIPRVARHLLPVWLKPPLVVDGQVVVVARDDEFMLGVLMSAVHRHWARALGSYMGVGNDLRYTPSTCFDTFPFPTGQSEQRAEVEQLARTAIEVRKDLLNAWPEETLTGLYNLVEKYRLTPDPRAPIAPLAVIHDRLDTVVAACYGWTWPLSEESVLEKLFTLNQAAAQ